MCPQLGLTFYSVGTEEFDTNLLRLRYKERQKACLGDHCSDVMLIVLCLMCRLRIQEFTERTSKRVTEKENFVKRQVTEVEAITKSAKMSVGHVNIHIMLREILQLSFLPSIPNSPPT